MDENYDSVYFYKIENKNNLKKFVVGIEKDITGNII